MQVTTDEMVGVSLFTVEAGAIREAEEALNGLFERDMDVGCARSKIGSSLQSNRVGWHRCRICRVYNAKDFEYDNRTHPDGDRGMTENAWLGYVILNKVNAEGYALGRQMTSWEGQDND